MRRYESYVSSLAVLSQASSQDLSNEFVMGGVIDKFRLQFELGWKLLKRLLAYEGEAIAATGSPRDILKAAHGYYDFLEEDVWLSMLRERNNSAHIYDGTAAKKLVATIIDSYIPAFCDLQKGLEERYGELLSLPDDEVR